MSLVATRTITRTVKLLKRVAASLKATIDGRCDCEQCVEIRSIGKEAQKLIGLLEKEGSA